MDALTLLTADHNRVRGLFARFEEAHESDNALTMRDVVTRIGEELENTSIEEQIFYPAIDPLSHEMHEHVAESNEEHRVAKRLLDELRRIEPASDEWVAKVKVLIEAVEHHAGEEEDEMWPGIRSGMERDEREALGNRLLRRKLELGAPAPAVDLTKGELMDKAREQEIPGRSKMSKDELAVTVDPR